MFPHIKDNVYIYNMSLILGIIIILYIILLYKVCLCCFSNCKSCIEVLDVEDKKLDELDQYESATVNGPDLSRAVYIKALTDIYKKYDNLIKTPLKNPEFVFQRAEGFIRKADRVYGVKFREYKQLEEKRNIQTNKRKTKAKIEAKRIKLTPSSAPTPIPALDEKVPVVDQYFKTVKTFTGDSQNVHDNVVCKNSRETYETIKKELKNCTQLDTIADIQRVAETYGEPEKRKRILDVILRMSGDLKISSLEDTEKNILLNTWNRAYHPRNVDLGHTRKIKEAVLDQLNDCYSSSGGMVCGSGRANRVLSSLATIDYAGLGTMMTGEAHRNEAFNFAQQKIKNVIKEFEEKGNTEEKKYAKSFSDMSIDTDGPELFNASKKFKILVMQDVDKYAEKNKDNLPSNIRTEIEAALSL